MNSSVAESLDTKAVSRLVELVAKKRALEADVKTLSREIAEIEESLLEQFGEAGVSSIRTEGGTVSLSRQLWATCKDGDYERACSALRAAGLDEFVQPRFNSNSLSAYFRELDREGRPIPAALEGAIDVAERFQLRVTKR
jgi:hypothetical protein